MGIFTPQRKIKSSYNLLKDFDYYLPDIKGLFILLALLIAGALLGNLVTAGLMLLPGGEGLMSYSMLLSYPVMFIPAMLYAASKSKFNRDFDMERPVPVDQDKFGIGGFLGLAAAVVISRDYGTWSNTMIIDAGTNEGVAKDMPVITPSGVVGFISEAYPHSARVQLLTDPRTSIGAIVQRPESRVSSVVRGNGNVPSEPQFVNIAKDADILEGDTLVTSGFGSIYPKGLYVGTIVSIHQNDNDFVKYAVIRPSVDFSKLEEVFVILKSSDTGSYDKPGVAPKLVPQTNRDKVEGIKGAAAL